MDMDLIREKLSEPKIVVIVSLVIGLIVGWMVIGWWLWPVQWVDASPQQLRGDFKNDYMRMVVESYIIEQDAGLAKARYDQLGEGAEDALVEVEADPGMLSQAEILNFRAAIGVGPGEEETKPADTEETESGEAAGSSSFVRVALPIMCVAVLLVAGVFIAVMIIRSRTGEAGEPTSPKDTEEFLEIDAEEGYGYDENPPIKQFMASYKLGDDQFDDNESIDSPAGEFLGECGVGISETIGMGDPKKVTAFEMWLFDKNDIQTVTKVAMSAHAFLDENSRQRLMAKGEPVLAEPGTETVLETEKLYMIARIVDLAYGEGALPEQSFFDRFIIELSVWTK